MTGRRFVEPPSRAAGCPGEISPVSGRTMRRCLACAHYEREGVGMDPAMVRMPDGTFHCRNEVPR